MSFTDFVKPYPNGYEDGESGNTPVTAAILNTNYDGFLLALNSWASGMETSLNQKADSSSVGQAISSISGQLVNMQDAINQKSTVSLSDLLSTGTLIGTMVINGVTYNLYAPSGGSGGSSVEWEQIQLTGTKIAEVTIDGVTTDIYAPSGGSGGSGHTILDDDGTALAQEDDLQFVGVYSEDNSTDEVTKVNIYREMTKTEFDLLSDDEKKGFIRVTDEPDIYSDGHFQPVIYSTEEREIGVWTDGKPLYQKTLSIPTSSQNTTYDVSALDIDTCVKIDAFMSGNGSVPDGYWYSASNYVSVNYYDGDLFINAPTQYSNNSPCIVTLYYTKTTDVAGSGSWTPQGVPTHKYSTEEHVVGTYFGDTLYEKTIVLTSDVSIADSWTTIYTDALIGNIAQLVDVKYNNVENKGVYGVLNYKPNGNNLQAVYPISGGLNVLAGARFTLQYTKTS